MIKTHNIDTNQITFWPTYTTDERIQMLQNGLSKAKNQLNGLFKRYGQLKEEIEFQEGILEDLAMENISLSSP